MNRLLASMIEKNTPRYNPDVANGLACIYIPQAMAWLDGIFKSASKSFPKGLIYEGLERCTPQEEFFEATKLRGNKRIYDLAESDLYMIRLNFSFEDENGKREPIPDRFLYLPYVNEAGIFRISGSMFHVTGVLSDRVITPNISSIFVRLIRDRLTFYHVGHTLRVNERRETFNVVWSRIYQKTQKDRSAPATTKAHSSVAHYLFAKFGLMETFEKYVGFRPRVMQWTPEYVAPPETVVCRSSYHGTRARPDTYGPGVYVPSDLVMEIPVECWGPETSTFVSGFFYVVDHFPDRMVFDRINDQFLWNVLLGHVIFSGASSEGRLYERIMDHFGSLDDYLDVMVRNKLEEIGWVLNDFYDLIAKIMTRFPNLLLGGQIDVNSMYSKNIEINYYMLFEVATKIFKLIYYLKKPKTRKPLSYNVVKEAFNKNMSPRTIFKVTKNKMVVESVTYCGDHKIPKLTSKITEQEAGSYKFKKKPKRVQITEANHIHASMIECGNMLFLGKSNPMPNTRISPYVKVDLKTGAFIPNPEFAPELARLQEMLTRISTMSSEELATIDDDFTDLLRENELEDEEPSDDDDDSDENTVLEVDASDD